MGCTCLGTSQMVGGYIKCAAGCYGECASCTSQYECTTCVDPNASPYSTYGCACKVGYYNMTALISSGTCLICYSECSTCNQTSKCIICKDSNAEAHLSVGCVCKSSYYNATSLVSNGACFQCYKDCETCTQNLLCTNCVAKDASTHSVVGCECKIGYYNLTSLTVASACLTCFSECKKCSTQYGCTECFDYNAEPKITGGCLCNSGYYNISQITAEGICLPCFSECKNCSWPLICGSCIDSNAEPHLYIGCICKAGYYNTSILNTEGTCKAKPCSDTNSFMNKNNECECNESFYEDESGTCLSCFKDCKSCNSLNCTVCKVRFAENNGPRCVCKSGYYNSSNTEELMCSICPSNCETCDDSGYCLDCKFKKMNVVNGVCECPENSTIIDNTCTALDGYYLDFNNKGGYFAESCNSSCKTCNDKGFDNCTSCDPKYKPVEGQCIICQELCNKCEMICTKCVENADFNNTGCDCLEGFKKSGNQCKVKYFKASLIMLEKNYAKIIFSEKTLKQLFLENFIFTVKDRDDLKVKMIKNIYNSEYHFALMFSKSLAEGTEISVNITQRIIYSELRSQLKNYILVGSLKLFTLIVIDPSVKAILDSTSSASKSAVSSSLGISIVSNPSAAWTTLNMIQLIAYIPLSSSPLPNNTRLFLTAFSGYNIIPNPIVYIFSEKTTSESYLEAREYGIDSSVFLINIGPSFATFLAITIMCPFIYLLSKCKKGKIAAKALKILGNYKFSFFLRFWTQMYLEIGIYGIIQLKSDPSPNFSAYFNILLATVFTIGFVLTVPLLLVSTHISSSNISEGSGEFLQKWGSLYSEFKNDRGYWSSQFYFVYFARRLAFVLSQIYLNNSHYLQTILNASFSVIVLLHLIVYRPFKERAIMISNFIGELCTTIVMGLCCLFVWDLGEEIQERVEIAIMFTVFATMAIQLLVSIYCFGKAMGILLRKIEKDRSLKFVKKAEGFKLEPQISLT